MVRKTLSVATTGIASLALVAAIVTVLVAVASILGGDLTWERLISGLVAAAAAILLLRYVSAQKLLAGYSSLIYVVLFAPIVVVVVYAFNGGTSVTVFEDVSLRWFAVALGDESITSTVVRSAQISLLVALVSVTLGTTGAIFLARARPRTRLPIEGVILLAIVVPELVIAISLLLFFVNGGFALGNTTMVIGHSLLGTALVTMIVRSRYATMGPALERASADLGAGPWSTLWQVTLPGLVPAIGAAALLAFTFSFDNVVTSQFTSGAGNQTWPLRILSALRFGLKPDINATATMMLAVTVLGLLGAGLLLRRSFREER